MLRNIFIRIIMLLMFWFYLLDAQFIEKLHEIHYIFYFSILFRGYILAFCFSPAPEPRYFERASLNFHVRLSTKVRRAGLWTVRSR